MIGYHSKRRRVATFLGLSIVTILAQTLKDSQIEPLSIVGLTLIAPTLILTALLLSFILHSNNLL